MIVKVTEQDIRDGQRGQCRACPIALAVSRQFPNRIVEVTSLSIRLFEPDSGKESDYFLSPPKVHNFVQDFDANREVKPITFKIEHLT